MSRPLVGLNLEIFEDRYGQTFQLLLNCGGVATGAQLSALLGESKARTWRGAMIKYKLAKRLDIGWGKRFALGVTQHGHERFEFFFGEGQGGDPVPRSWSRAAVRFGLARLEYYFKTRRLLTPLTAEVFEREFKRLAVAEYRKLNAELEAIGDPKTVITKRDRARYDEIRSRWVDSGTLRSLVEQLPTIGAFLALDDEVLRIVFVDDQHGAKRYRELGETFEVVKQRLAGFVEVSLEVLCESKTSTRLVSAHLDQEGASVTDLGFARYLLSPRELGRVFTRAELDVYREILGV